jgi:hypothetical protein
MAASKSKDIRDGIISVIEPIQRDGEDAFMDVLGHTHGQFDSFPSVRVLPVQVDPERAAYRQSDRTVAFIARTYVEVKNDGSDFDMMYELTDLIVDALEKADADNTFHQDLATYQMAVSQGEWSEEETQSGTLLMADVNIEVTYSHNV